MKKGFTIIELLVTVIVLIVLFSQFNPIYFVQSGKKAVTKKLGVINTEIINEGIHLKNPFIGESVHSINVTPRSNDEKVLTYTKDNQPIEVIYTVIWSFPQENLAETYILYGSDPYSYFCKTKIVDALKAIGGHYTASQFVTERDSIRKDFINTAKLAVINEQTKKAALNIIDLPITNVDFDDQYENAIKAKQVAEQEAQKAQYKLQQAKIDKQASIEKAEGEAQALSIKAQAITKNPEVVKLNEIEKWDGHYPLGAKVIGGGATIVDTK